MKAGAFHICSFTDFADLTIQAAGLRYRFEFSHRFGPLMLGKRGQELQSVPGARSPFWKALHLWCAQGHQVEDGQCRYVIPPAMRMVTLAGRHSIELRPTDDAAVVRAMWLQKCGAPVPSEPPHVWMADDYADLRSTTRTGEDADSGTHA